MVDTGARTVLIVDDMPFNLRALRRFLAADGYSIREATDGETALAEAAANHPDVVLLDVMIPRLNGYEVCRRLKANPATRDIAVVMMTGLRAQENREKGMAAGADEFLIKPLKASAVQAVVRRFMERRGAARANA